MPKTDQQPDDFIVPLNMNGLEGRMMRAPCTKKTRQREILLIYGHHAMLERWWGLVENLQAYGNVTMPDMPGFGGMDSLNKVGVKPTTDDLADYLAAFIKLRFKRKRITIYAISYGFVVVTRMLQKYPELTKKIDLLISAVGFMHGDDITMSRLTKITGKPLTRFFATRPIAFLIKNLAFNKVVLRKLYTTFPNSKRRMIEVGPEQFNLNIEFEVKLWRANDVRTHWLTTSEMLKLNNCKKPVNLPVVHIFSEHDHYLDNISVEQHMHQVFADYVQFVSKTKAHVPHTLANKTEMAVMVPLGLRRLLNKKTA